MAELKINDVVLEMDILDADVMAKYEDLNQTLLNKIQDPLAYEGKKTSEGMLYQCRCIDKFFDKMFGEGTSRILFSGNNNLGERMAAYGQVVSNANDAAKTQISEITSKYGAQRIQKRQQYTNRKKYNGSKRRYY